MVICYTPGGRSGGGTGQAIRVAELYGIPVFDLAREYDQRALCEFVNAQPIKEEKPGWTRCSVNTEEASWDDKLGAFFVRNEH
jgi:hypothetical protein